MNKDDLTQLVTHKDLETFRLNFLSDIKEIINPLTNPKKLFYSPKEFAHATGMKYSTVIYRCKVGKLKSRQDGASCSWQISASELDRFNNEANENI
ncbi:MAG: hypothetical protein IPJ32_04685 [Sphingobacteriaceae bacterium]|nr:hypothetical protein [Sphingobacteriaceae bacterium]